jgi:hypothetical protein
MNNELPELSARNVTPRVFGPDGLVNHGHVWPRVDGGRARCGGPGKMCKVCSEHERLAQLGY